MQSEVHSCQASFHEKPELKNGTTPEKANSHSLEKM